MKNEALKVLKNRRAIRQFKPDQISQTDLDAVLEAGTYAATGAGTQGPIIVAVQDPDTVVQLDAMNAKVLNNEQMQHPYYGAPTIILVLATEKSMTHVEDCSLVAGNLMRLTR